MSSFLVIQTMFAAKLSINQKNLILMKKIIFSLLAFALVFTSCEKTETTPDDPIINNDITGEITTDMVFKSGEIYIIDGTIRVNNATLTFQPGAIIKFTEGSAFDFSYWEGDYATVIAKGTKELPIIFTSASPNPANGDWDGLRFYNGANNCEFDYCIIEYAGGNDSYGSIYIKETEISLTNCEIRNAENVGIILKHEAGFTAFDQNFFTNIDSYPISVFVNNVHTITGSNNYETALGIWIEDDESFTKQGEYFWTNQGIPYYQEGTIRFGSGGQGCVITIEKGTEILFMEGGLWDVAYWDNEFATIIAEGTTEEPIIFSSANPSPSAGDWDGVHFFNGANNCSFNHCIFEFGGDDSYYGMISIKESHVAFTNCEFYYSASKAITVLHEAWFTDFGNNTFLGNELYPITILPNFVHTIIGTNSITTDMGILVSNDEELDKQGEYLWTNQSAPYIIEGTTRIGAPGSGVELTIEAGTTIKFYTDAQFDIAYWSDHTASLIANGTIDNPIVFTSANPVPNNDDWDGLNYSNGSHNCVLNNCIISYAGGRDTPWGAITLSNAGSPINLSNTHFAHIASHGISVDEDESSVDYSNNITFEDLSGVEYYIR